MKITELPFVKEFVRLCEIGDAQGFHERNGGNLSYHMRPTEAKAVRGILGAKKPGPWTDVDPKGDVAVPGLGGEWFLVTGSGKFFRNVPYDTEASVAICELDKEGAHYRVRWGLRDGGRPTSEFSSHLMNLEVKDRVSGGKVRVIYHAHPANLIAMTYVVPPTDRDFTRALWNTMTECAVVAPEGIGVVPWMVPGGREIAVATSRLMETYNNVVWAYHGLFCTADTFDNAMGQMEMLEKAAKIYMLVLASGRKPVGGITSEGFRAIGAMYGGDIPERFL